MSKLERNNLSIGIDQETFHIGCPQCKKTLVITNLDSLYLCPACNGAFYAYKEVRYKRKQEEQEEQVEQVEAVAKEEAVEEVAVVVQPEAVEVLATVEQEEQSVAPIVLDVETEKEEAVILPKETESVSPVKKTVNLFQKYYKKLAREGLIKAILNGISTGAVVLFIASFIAWMTNPDFFWLAIVLFGAVTAVDAWWLYQKKYKPTTKAIARRVDDLGLEERLLTMIELENDESYIAMRQREDAQAAFAKVDADLLKVVISSATKILAVCLGFIAISMNTVSTLSSAQVIPSGSELWESMFGTPPIEYEITYTIEGQGQLVFEDGTVISNEETYIVRVEEGMDGIEVYAVGAHEWVFIEWADGYQYPTRTERNVEKSMTITVIFSEISGSAGNNNASDMPNDLPPIEGMETDKSQPSKNPSDTYGGTYEPSNQIIDDKTYYGDEYDAAYDKIQEELAQDGEILEEQKDITAGYLGGIKADAEEDEDE